jgi:hypothetical protein
MKTNHSQVRYTVIKNGQEYSGCNLKFDIRQGGFILRLSNDTKYWIGKISRVATPHIFDLNDRALLAYDLATLLKIPMPKIMEISKDSFTNFDTIYKIHPEIKNSPQNFYNFDNLLICQYKGNPLTEENIAGIDVQQLLMIFIFDCWIGSFDKDDSEFLVDENNKFWAIDYQLWGTVDDSGMSLGAEAITYTADENSFDMCLGDRTKKLLFASGSVNLNHPILKEIENLSEKQIKKLVDKYKFFKRGFNEELINKQMTEYLVQRKKVIREQLKTYIAKNIADK